VCVVCECFVILNSISERECVCAGVCIGARGPGALTPCTLPKAAATVKRPLGTYVGNAFSRITVAQPQEYNSVFRLVYTV